MTAPSSLATAKSELFALLNGAIAGVTSTYDFEPAGGDMASPVSVTITSAGMTPEDYLNEIRVYVNLKSGAQSAASTLDTIVMLIDARLGTDSHYGPSNWVIATDAGISALVAATVIESGRSDYY